MTKEARRIFYLGNQRDLFSELKKYFSVREDSFSVYACRQFLSIEELLSSFEGDGEPHLIILDFCESKDFAPVLQALRLFRMWHPKWSIAVCGVFDDKEDLVQAEYAFGQGMNYAFLKGVDTLQALNSLFYIAFEDETPCVSYAMAKVGKVSARISSLGFISGFNENSLQVDKDFRCDEEEVAMDSRLFEGFTPKKFELANTFEKGFSFNTPFSETLRIPFATGWDVGEDAFFEDTYQSWLLLNEDSFLHNRETVFVFTQSPSVVSSCWEWEVLRNAGLDIQARQSFVDSDRELFKFRPSLILFDVSGEGSFEELTLMLGQMSYEKALDECIVSIFGHPSTTQALRKLYARKNLIATKESLTGKRTFEMLDRLAREPGRKKNFSFKFNDPRLNVSFPLDVQVTSLTENEITFMCSQELPFYSVLKIQDPVECYVLIIPSLKNLSPNVHGHHYMGFLFGGDEADGRYLRQFVNYVLNHGLEKWRRVDVSGAPEQVSDAEETASAGDESGETAKKNIKESKSEEVAGQNKQNFEDTRLKTKGKFSKL